MRALDLKLIRNLLSMRGQALAIALVIACGVATVVMAFGTNVSLQETVDTYYERYRYGHIFAQLKRAPNSLKQRIEAIPGVGRVETRIVRDVTLDVPNMSEPALGRLISIPEQRQPELNKLVIRQGRWVDVSDPDEVIISENFAEAHQFGIGDLMSAIINGNKRKLKIVGIALTPEYIYAVAPGQLMPEDRTFAIMWMGHKALESAFDLKGAFNAVSLTKLRQANESGIITRLDALIEPYGGVGAAGRDEQISHVIITNELEQLAIVGQIIPPIFLGVAAFLLHIVITRLIQTQREQIGLLKAFGYSDLDIGWHFAKFVMVLTGLGVVIGIGMGMWMGQGMTEMYTMFFRFPFLHYQNDPSTIVLSVFIALGTTLAGTMQAVRKAVKIEPAVAMQTAPPVSYKVTLLEKSGLIARISEPSRMIFRHIRRWPIRAGLTVLGMSLSVGLLIAAMFPIDAFEHAIDVYYYQAQRQDATLTFTEARNPSSQRIVTNMPGILAAEPYRAVPVKLTNGHLSEQVSVMGMQEGMTIHRILDTALKPIEVPPKGLVLSAYLADQLNANIGDKVHMKLMTGKRKADDVVVAGLLEEYFGTSAYMNEHALAAFLQEPTLVSGFHVLVDEYHEDVLYKEIKNTPAVAGIALKTHAIRSFRNTIQETISISLMFYVVFGAMIAFGVVYNAARISLSERSRELASLRVLGFTQGEIAYILLGELAILTLASLPLGALIGYGLAALIALGFETEIFRIPIIVNSSTYALAMLVVVVSAIVSGLLVGRQMMHLDMIGVLKTRD